MSTAPGLSRRTFLGHVVTTGAFILGTRLVPGEAFARAIAPDSTPRWQAGVYIAIDVDGSVAIIAHRSEMGTGIRTSLPMVVAEELEADWARVTVVQATGDTKYGSQNTDGSCSIRDFHEAMRVAGASARRMLEQAAASTWNVPISKVARLDDAVARKVSGVQNVVRLDEATPPYEFKALGGAAVIADNSWAALQGRKALKVDWTDSPHAVFESAKFRQQLLDTVHAPAKVLRVTGDVDAAFAANARTHDASYYTAICRMRRWSRRLPSPNSAMARSSPGRRRRIHRRCRKPLPARSASPTQT